MNQKLLLGVGIIIILLIGGGAYWYMSSQPGTATSGNEAANENTSQSLKDLIGANRPVKCDFKDVSGAEGTVYVSGGMVRGDFTTTSGGQMMRAHMIARDNKSYMWVDGMNTGFMSSMMAGNVGATPTNGQTANFDTNKKLDYRCGAWSADGSFFELPTGVKFSDINALAPTPANTNTNVNTDGSADANTADCSVCDSAPAEARAQCRAALGC